MNKEKIEKALSFWRRVKMLEMIEIEPRYCEQIAYDESMNVKPSGVHRHLMQLEGAGLIKGEKLQGNERNILYSITSLGSKSLSEIK